MRSDYMAEYKTTAEKTHSRSEARLELSKFLGSGFDGVGRTQQLVLGNHGRVERIYPVSTWHTAQINHDVALQ